MRIIAGKHKGLSLNTFEADNIRPTTDRVRENIFNKIQFGIVGCSVLDLFCGTGAISLEFLSRGASKVVSVDNNINSIKLINQNFEKAKEKPLLIKNDFRSAVTELQGSKFNYIFLDPPFNTSFGEEAINYIEKYKLLDADGIIIYEHLVDKVFKIPDSFKIIDFRKYGTIAVTFIKGKTND